MLWSIPMVITTTSAASTSASAGAIPEELLPLTETPSATVVVPPALVAAICEAIVGMQSYVRVDRVSPGR